MNFFDIKVSNNFRQPEIADVVGVSQNRVSETLNIGFINFDKTYKEIADVVGMDQTSVSKNMKNFNIKEIHNSYYKKGNHPTQPQEGGISVRNNLIGPPIMYLDLD